MPCILCSVIDQEDWEGKIIAAGPASPQSDTARKEWPILGGSGKLWHAVALNIFKQSINVTCCV
jgi:hypothetical protein